MRKIILFLVLIALIFGISSYSKAALDPDAIGLWLFDEGEGDTAKDASGNQNDGEIINGKWDDGKFGGALEFGGDGYVQIPSSESLESPENEITMMAWINMVDINNKGIVYKGPFAGGDGDWSIHLSGNPAGTFHFRLNNSAFTRKGAEVPVEEWTHVAATYDGETCVMYINGELDGEAPFDQPIASSDVNLYLGSYWNATYGLNGAIDEVYILKRALTQDEIKAAMNGLLDMMAVEPLGKLAAKWGLLKIQ